MLLYPNQKVAIFIDGANNHYAIQACGKTMDYSAVHKYFAENSTFVKAFYYTGMFKDDGSFNPMTKLVDWLNFNGYCVRTKQVKEFTQTDGSVVKKGNMDIELCVDAMRLIPIVDHFVLFTGDGDFRYLVEALQSCGKIVTAVSLRNRVVADELRKQVDYYLDLVGDFCGKHAWVVNKASRRLVEDPVTRVIHGEPVIEPPVLAAPGSGNILFPSS